MKRHKSTIRLVGRVMVAWLGFLGARLAAWWETKGPFHFVDCQSSRCCSGFSCRWGEWAGTEAGSGGIQLIRSCLIGLALGHATYTVDYCTAGGSVAPVGVGVE